jgi:hypothetical protein
MPKSNTRGAGPAETTAGRTPENLGTPRPVEVAVPRSPESFERRLFRVTIRVPEQTSEQVAAKAHGRPVTPTEISRHSGTPAQEQVVRVKAASAEAAREFVLSKNPSAPVVAVEAFVPDRLSVPARSHQDHPDKFIEAA